MQDIGRRWTGVPMALLLGWILVLALEGPAIAAPVVRGPWSVCDGPPWLPSSTCVPKPLHDVDPQGRMLWLTAEMRVGPLTPEPTAVFVSAYAASAVYWDGRLIGANGHPSARPGSEMPGLRDAVFPLPDAAPGRHRLTLQMSSHNGFLRLRSPVTQVSVAPFEQPSTRTMRGYLPALISAGGLLIMIPILAVIWWTGNRSASSIYLLGAALFAAGQLGAEASRGLLDYPYPVHFLRIGLVLAFAAGFGFMLLAYLARRFAVAQMWPVLSAQAFAASIAVLLSPSFDRKTGLVLTCSMAIGLLLAIRAAARPAPGALPLIAMLALGLVLSLAAPYSFLDRDLYLWTAGLFVLLFTGEARRMRDAAVPEAPGALPRRSESHAPIGVYLGTAAGRRFLLPADIVRAAAADDYCEVFLVDGGSVLHPEPLQKLLAQFPRGFLRVHRSHAINLSHLRSFRKGPGSSVLLSDRSIAPVSRRRVATVLAAIEGRNGL
jgi:hypothetical protein